MKSRRLLPGASLHEFFARQGYSSRWLLLTAAALCCGNLAIADLSGEAALENTADSITWPMLPGDSLNHLAALFYPGNKPMQKRFVSKTLELSRELNPGLDPAGVFNQPSSLIIPDLKSLSRQAAPFKSHAHKSSKPSLKLHMSYRLQQAVEAVTPQMQAIYDDLSQRNTALKLQLEQLDQRFAKLQANLEQLKSAALAFLELSSPVVPKPAASVAITRVAVASTLQPTRQLPDNKSTPADAGWLILLAECLVLLLAFVAAIAAWAWIRKRLARQLEHKTDKQLQALRKNDFDPMQSALPGSGMVTSNADPGILSVEEIESVVEEARIFVSMGRTNEAIGRLVSYIEELPKAALAPWLYLMDIYRSLERKNDFVALAKRFHQTFNVMTPQWEEFKVAMIVADSLEQFPHIVPTLVAAWQTGEARQYLDTLLEDNRDGERAGFGLEVLQEIILLQGILEIRGEITQPALRQST